jgi:hypothetical protein
MESGLFCLSREGCSVGVTGDRDERPASRLCQHMCGLFRLLVSVVDGMLVSCCGLTSS